MLLESPSFYVGRGAYYRSVRKAYLEMMIHLFIKLRQSLGIPGINSVYSFRNQIANIFKLEFYIAKVCLNFIGAADKHVKTRTSCHKPTRKQK